MKGRSLKEFGGSCITPNVKNRRRDTDYDGYNDYQSFVTEKEWD